MIETRFQLPPAPLDLAALVALTGARPAESKVAGPFAITGVATLEWAGPSDLVFFDEKSSDPDEPMKLGQTDAGACLVPASLLSFVPAGAVALVTDEPRRAYLAVAGALFPGASKPAAMFGSGVAAGAVVHPDARLEPDVSVDPGAVIGPGAEIGRGAVIGANAIVGAGARIGRDSVIGAGAIVSYALIGDRVVIQQGASLGHGGLAEAALAPSLGRVIVQDDAEIGANAAVARGRRRDTIIGEATRIDALARIAPDVVIGRHCLVYAHASLAEAATVGDYSICGLQAKGRGPSLRDVEA